MILFFFLSLSLSFFLLLSSHYRLYNVLIDIPIPLLSFFAHPPLLLFESIYIYIYKCLCVYKKKQGGFGFSWKRRGKGERGNPRGSVRVKRKLKDRQTDRQGERVNRGAKKEGKGREECRATGAGRDFDSLGKRVRRILLCFVLKEPKRVCSSSENCRGGEKRIKERGN